MATDLQRPIGDRLGPALKGTVRVPSALAAEVEFLADLLERVAFFDGVEVGGGVDPATDLVDALEIHSA